MAFHELSGTEKFCNETKSVWKMTPWWSYLVVLGVVTILSFLALFGFAFSTALPFVSVSFLVCAGNLIAGAIVLVVFGLIFFSSNVDAMS